MDDHSNSNTMRGHGEPNIPVSNESSILQASHNVRFNGGPQFNTAPFAAIAINLVQPAVNGGDDGKEFSVDGGNSEFSRGLNNKRDSRPPPPLPVQRSCDIYHRHLAVKGRGTPMWLTEPSSTLPNAYRRRGIAIGDVGIITASGGFDFMFNVCLPADHPINQERVPEDFSPLFPELRPSDIHRHMEPSPNSHLASASVVKCHSGNDSSGISFVSSASEGAILMMPQGVYKEDLANVSLLRRYTYKNVESWYAYTNKVLGREARNGDLRLVVGCDKTSSWGMATFANSSAQDFHLNFKATDENGTYKWEYSGDVETRVGPVPSQTEELRLSDDSGHSGVYNNQCLFVRTESLKLRVDVWQSLGFDIEIGMAAQGQSYSNPSASDTTWLCSKDPSYPSSTTSAGPT